MKGIPNFSGVYNSDNMKDPMIYPSYLIVNFSPSFSPGTHFIAMIFDEEQTCTYFDPLGLAKAPKIIHDFMKKKLRKYKKNRSSNSKPLFNLLWILLYVGYNDACK